MLLYGEFQDRGYTFEAYIPNSDAEPVAFELRILVGAHSKYVLLVPLLYTPTFGVDGVRQGSCRVVCYAAFFRGGRSGLR